MKKVEQTRELRPQGTFNKKRPMTSRDSKQRGGAASKAKKGIGRLLDQWIRKES